jgi:predicted secreted acid phosphatase
VFRSVLLAAGLALLGACTAPVQNLGELKQQLTAWQASGAYDRALAAVDRDAEAWVRAQAGKVTRPALVLDIDETSLSNWPQLAANDFGYIPGGNCDALPAGPCGGRAWELSARAAVIAPTLALFNTAKAASVAVFFITGRPEDERDATMRNLRTAGYEGWSGLVLRPLGPRTPSAADYKAVERAKIEAQGYTIIANVGDQPSDLAGGHALKTFLLPNPFYRIP